MALLLRRTRSPAQVWEIKQRALIDMSADRGAYICQSQSLNLFIAAPDRKTLTSMVSGLVSGVSRAVAPPSTCVLITPYSTSMAGSGA